MGDDLAGGTLEVRQVSLVGIHRNICIGFQTRLDDLVEVKYRLSPQIRSFEGEYIGMDRSWLSAIQVSSCVRIMTQGSVGSLLVEPEGEADRFIDRTDLVGAEERDPLAEPAPGNGRDRVQIDHGRARESICRT